MASELKSKTVLVVDDGQTFTAHFRNNLSEIASENLKVLTESTERD